MICLMVTNEYIRTIEFISCETADSEIKRERENGTIIMSCKYVRKVNEDFRQIIA